MDDIRRSVAVLQSRNVEASYSFMLPVSGWEVDEAATQRYEEARLRRMRAWRRRMEWPTRQHFETARDLLAEGTDAQLQALVDLAEAKFAFATSLTKFDPRGSHSLELGAASIAAHAVVEWTLGRFKAAFRLMSYASYWAVYHRVPACGSDLWRQLHTEDFWPLPPPEDTEVPPYSLEDFLEYEARETVLKRRANRHQRRTFERMEEREFRAAVGCLEHDDCRARANDVDPPRRLALARECWAGGRGLAYDLG